MSDFRPGDIVYLNSGGPPLVVTRIKVPRGPYAAERSHVFATWTDGESARYSGSFLAVCLTKEKPGDCNA